MQIQKKQIVTASTILAILLILPAWIAIPAAYAVKSGDTYNVSTLRGRALLLQDGETSRFEASIQATVVVSEDHEEYIEFTISDGQIEIGDEQFAIEESRGFASLDGGRFRLIAEVEADGGDFQLVLGGHQLRVTEDGVVMKVCGMLWSDDAVYLLHFIILRTHA